MCNDQIVAVKRLQVRRSDPEAFKKEIEAMRYEITYTYKNNNTNKNKLLLEM